MYCSNVASIDEFGQPLGQENNDNLPTTPSEELPNAPANKQVKNANFFIPPKSDEIFVFPGKQSCAYWFGRDYPFRSPYENDPEITNPAIRKKDT